MSFVGSSESSWNHVYYSVAQNVSVCCIGHIPSSLFIFVPSQYLVTDDLYVYFCDCIEIFFEDGQYHNEQIKLEFRINEICFGSMYSAHNFNLHGMWPLLLHFLLPATLKLCCFCFSFNNSSLFSQIYLKWKRQIIHRDNNCQTFMKVLYIFVLAMVLVCHPYLIPQ